MITQIGIVAGEIITLLEQEDGPMTLYRLVEFLDEPKEIIYMSIGWLIREGYVTLEPTEEGYFLLREGEKVQQDWGCLNRILNI